MVTVNFGIIGFGIIVLGLILWDSISWNSWWGFCFVLIGIILIGIEVDKNDEDCVKTKQKKERTLQEPV